MPHSDFELLKNSDPSALKQIHARYSRRLFWIGKQIIDDSFVVENLVQDTFLILWDRRDRIESPKHIFFFLRLVLKRECYSHYTNARNKFFKKVKSLEDYENYQDYLAGYDPIDVAKNLDLQDFQQKFLDEIRSVLPLLRAERRHLIELCLKYGFHYKLIAKVMGKGIIETSNEVKRAIEDLKTIIHQEALFEAKQKHTPIIRPQESMTEEQFLVLKLRFEKKLSFATISQELNLSPKEVNDLFKIAYGISQQNQ